MVVRDTESKGMKDIRLCTFTHSFIPSPQGSQDGVPGFKPASYHCLGDYLTLLGGDLLLSELS